MLPISRAQITGMNCHYCHYSLDYFLDAMVRQEITNIELWAASPHFYVEDSTPEIVREVRRKIEERGLKLICFTPEQVTYPINIASKEDYLRHRSVDYYLKAIDCATDLGTSMMLLTPGWGYLDEPLEDAWARSADSISKIAKCAQQHGIILALEHLSPISSNLINTAEDLKRMLNQLSLPNLKAMIDVVQIGIVGEKIDDYFNLLGDDLVHIHFADGTPGGHLALGDGTLPLQENLKAILDNHYRGYISLEIADRRYFGDPTSADRRSLKKLHSWIDASLLNTKSK